MCQSEIKSNSLSCGQAYFQVFQLDLKILLIYILGALFGPLEGPFSVGCSDQMDKSNEEVHSAQHVDTGKG